MNHPILKAIRTAAAWGTGHGAAASCHKSPMDFTVDTAFDRYPTPAVTNPTSVGEGNFV